MMVDEHKLAAGLMALGLAVGTVGISWSAGKGMWPAFAFFLAVACMTAFMLGRLVTLSEMLSDEDTAGD
jgi:membrane protein implicated in regulation of membrane protease activity